MKLNEKFISYNSENDSVLVPVGNTDFSGVVRGNKTFGFILDCLSEDITETELAKKMRSQFKNADESSIQADIDKTLKGLRKIGALDE